MGIASRIVKKATKKPLTKKQIQAKTAEVFGNADKFTKLKSERGILAGANAVPFDEYLTMRNAGYDYVPVRQFQEGLAGDVRYLPAWKNRQTGKYGAFYDGKILEAEAPQASFVRDATNKGLNPYGGQVSYTPKDFDQAKVLRETLGEQKWLKNYQSSGKAFENSKGRGHRLSMFVNDPELVDIEATMFDIDRRIKECTEIAADHKAVGNDVLAERFAKKAMELENFKNEHILDVLNPDPNKVMYDVNEFYGPFIEDIFGK